MSDSVLPRLPRPVDAGRVHARPVAAARAGGPTAQPAPCPERRDRLRRDRESTTTYGRVSIAECVTRETGHRRAHARHVHVLRHQHRLPRTVGAASASSTIPNPLGVHDRAHDRPGTVDGSRRLGRLVVEGADRLVRHSARRDRRLLVHGRRPDLRHVGDRSHRCMLRRRIRRRSRQCSCRCSAVRTTGPGK